MRTCRLRVPYPCSVSGEHNHSLHKKEYMITTTKASCLHMAMSNDRGGDKEGGNRKENKRGKTRWKKGMAGTTGRKTGG